MDERRLSDDPYWQRLTVAQREDAERVVYKVVQRLKVGEFKRRTFADHLGYWAEADDDR